MSASASSFYDRWAAPYEIHHGWRALYHRTCTLEHHEILHYLRAKLEARHRERLWCKKVYRPYGIAVDRPDQLDPIPHDEAKDYWNKSVPIYILPGDGTHCKPYSIPLSLLNYLYKRWFRPYRSDIEYGQFIAKVIYAPNWTGRNTGSAVVNLVTTLNKSICSKLDEARQSLEGKRHGSYMEEKNRLPHYHIRPLFKAIAIAVCGEDYNFQVMTTKIRRMPALVVLTGHTEGLSAPITFDSIMSKAQLGVISGRHVARTCLETAVDIVMALEAREEAAFGPFA